MSTTAGRSADSTAPAVAARPAAAGTNAANALSPKQLSQLLWAAATLQLHLPEPWLVTYCAASFRALHLYTAQDVANTCWALASLKQQQLELSGMASYQQQQQSLDRTLAQLSLPPDWLSELVQQQLPAVAGGLTGQGVANTLWGLAVLELPLQPQLLQCLLDQALQRGSSLQPQELANVVWGAARCLHLATTQQHQQLQALHQSALHASTSAAAAVAADADDTASCRQRLQQLLQQCGPELSRRLQPRDWSNIIWAAGLAGVNPGKALLQALWRKTPAGFSTSLNPHFDSSAANGSAAAAGFRAAAQLSPTRWSPQALANTLWGCAKLRVLPPKIWLQGFEAATVAVLPGFSEQQLANMLWALGELRHCPSDAWLQLFWQQAAGMPQQLLQAASATAVPQQYGTSRPAALSSNINEVLRAQQHVVMVLQACGRLALQPPAAWLEGVAEGLLQAADVVLSAPQAQQQMQHQHQQGLPDGNVSACLHSYAAAVLALSRVSHAAVAYKSNDSSGSNLTALAAAGAGRQLLQKLQHANSGEVLHQLPAEDMLALLLALPKLQMPVAEVHSLGAVLLQECLQLQAQQMSSSQLAQLAFAAAAVCCCDGDGAGARQLHEGVGSAGHQGLLWQHLQAANQQMPQASTSGSSSSSRIAGQVFSQLAAALTPRCSSMTAVDLRFSLAAMAKLQTSMQVAAAAVPSSSRSRRRRQQQLTTQGVEVAAFVAAAGSAVGARWPDFTPHQLAVVAASLAALGFSPEPRWFDALLQYSSCELANCRNGDLVNLVQSLPVLLDNMCNQSILQQQQQQTDQADLHSARHSSSSNSVLLGSLRHQQKQQQQQRRVLTRGTTLGSSATQQLLQECLADWQSESEQRMASFSAPQLLRIVRGLAKLHRYAAVLAAAPDSAFGAADSRQQLGLVLGLSAVAGPLQQPQWLRRQQQSANLWLQLSWQACFLQAAAAQVHNLGGVELLLLLSAVRMLGLSPGQEWCAAVAASAAARAASAAYAGVFIRAHHVGWFALYLQRLGYTPPTEQQAVLLQYVARCCEVQDPRRSASRRASAGDAAEMQSQQALQGAAGDVCGGRDSTPVAVRPRQLWQLLALLAVAGWDVDESWVQDVQRSEAGARLRMWLGQRPQHGSWQEIWVRILL